MRRTSSSSASSRGTRAVRSQRGSSGHQQNPFMLLRRPATTEAAGEAIGMSLVYSGNFLAQVEVDPYDTVRARIGFDPETIRWQISPGMDLQIPEAVLVWSRRGHRRRLRRLSPALP